MAQSSGPLVRPAPQAIPYPWAKELHARVQGCRKARFWEEVWGFRTLGTRVDRKPRRACHGAQLSCPDPRPSNLDPALGSQDGWGDVLLPPSPAQPSQHSGFLSLLSCGTAATESPRG